MRRRLVEVLVSDPCCQSCRRPRNESVHKRDSGKRGWEGETYFIPVGVDFLTFKVSETSIFSHDCKNSVLRHFDGTVEFDLCSYQKKILMFWFFLKKIKKKFWAQIFFSMK